MVLKLRGITKELNNKYKDMNYSSIKFDMGRYLSLKSALERVVLALDQVWTFDGLREDDNPLDSLLKSGLTSIPLKM